MRVTADYTDLLGIQHASGATSWDPSRPGSLDCAGVVAEILLRVNGPAAQASFLSRLAGGSFDGFLELECSSYEPQLADIIVSTNAQGLPHVSAIVALKPCLALTSAYKLGVFAARLSSVANIECIYRYAGDQS